MNARCTASIPLGQLNQPDVKDDAVQTGRVGSIDVRGPQSVCGDTLLITNANIDQFDF